MSLKFAFSKTKQKRQLQQRIMTQDLPSVLASGFYFYLLKLSKVLQLCSGIVAVCMKDLLSQV